MHAPEVSSPNTAPTGLTATEAAARLAADGPNLLPGELAPPWWRQLLGQLTHFFALMLWVAAALALVAGTPQLSIAIVAVVIVNGVFSFAQERRAEHAARELNHLLPRSAVVIRDGRRMTIDASEIVRGDLVALEAGDRVSADLEIVEGRGLTLDVSTLTGESVPDHPGTGDAAHAGTYVVEGDGRGVATACGDQTRLAEIALLSRAGHRRPSPLALELHRVVSTIARIALGIGVVFFVIALALGMGATSGFVLALGVTVALVPEGLLPTVTLALAVGAQRMAERHALVRHLESVETLGSTTFICTDKTGTLTRNQMAVVRVWTPAGSVELGGNGYDPDGTVSGEPGPLAAARVLLGSARACSTGRAVRADGGWIAEGDPMEAAIDAAAHRIGALRQGEPDDGARATHQRMPFDPKRKRTGVVTDAAVIIKGAPESVLASCDDATVPDELEVMAASGLRVIAVASRPVTATDLERDRPIDGLETGLRLLGLVALEDPPREEVRSSIEACRRAGIKLAMVTGDHPATACAIGRLTGLVLEGSPVVDEADLPEDDDELASLLDRDGAVIARVQPESKLRIARVLQEAGHVVAMTGDGVNDGPALRQADIGIAMGASGTDVAREASDLVLLDDNFETIVAAIELGRATFSNIRRFLTYHLTDNVAELTPFLVFAVSAGRVPLALSVLQILCLDIGTDLVPALALGAEGPTPGVLDQPPRRGHLIDRALVTRVFGVLGPAEALTAMAAFLVTFVVAGWRPGDEFPDSTVAIASGATFACVVVGQAANAFACRSERRPVWAIPLRTNRFLLPAVAVELVALALFLGIPAIAEQLGQAPPPLTSWIVVVAVVPILVTADALHKAARRRREQRAPGLLAPVPLGAPGAAGPGDGR